jgi:signal transduction histidine kinase
MRERAESVGAKLEFKSKLGKGTQVSLIWTNPLKKEAS